MDLNWSSKDYTYLTISGKTIIIYSIPSHVNIQGSERANNATKSLCPHQLQT